MPPRIDLMPRPQLIENVRSLKIQLEQALREKQSLTNALVLKGKECDHLRSLQPAGLPMMGGAGRPACPTILMTGSWATPITHFGPNGLRTMKIEDGTTFLMGRSGRAYSLDGNLRLPNFDRMKTRIRKTKEMAA